MGSITSIDRSTAIFAGLCGIACGALGVILMWRAIARARERAERQDVVDVAAEDSFPASDPPSWTTGRG